MAIVRVRAVRELFRELLLGIDEVDVIGGKDAIHFENRPFTPPPPPALHIREAVGITTEPRLGPDIVHVFGNALYAVRFGIGRGTEAAEDLQLAITTAFQNRAYLQGRGHTVYIDLASRLDIRQDDAAFMAAPIAVSWRAYSFETQETS